jgi:hypothetical protein
VSRRLAALVAALAAVTALAVPAANAAPKMLAGLFDDAQFLYGNPGYSYPQLAALHGQLIRVTLNWGGRFAVAARRPANASNPADKAYNWSLYDRTLQFANQYGIRVVFTIVGTPAWANGGHAANVPPKNPVDLQKFAFAAATRYSGTTAGRDGRALPPVRLWLAWNEPNNPVFLTPQYRKVGTTSTIASAAAYAKICKAVYSGVHSTFLSGEKVGCGVTSPRGNNNPNSTRPSVSPLPFLRALKKAAPALEFDAYAHHPYYGQKTDQPGKEPPRGLRGNPATAITLGNIGSLVTELTQLYGPRRVWITEYGYQTNPPDRVFGVTLAQQAAYLTTSFAIARKNPRIDMMLWFLLKDEPKLDGWQSGFYTAQGKRKPAYAAFQKMALAAGSTVGRTATKR